MRADYSIRLITGHMIATKSTLLCRNGFSAQWMLTLVSRVRRARGLLRARRWTRCESRHERQANRLSLIRQKPPQTCIGSSAQFMSKRLKTIPKFASEAAAKGSPPEKLSFVAGRIERQPSRSVGEALRGEDVAKNATFSLRSVN